MTSSPGVWHVSHCGQLFFPSARLPSSCPACGKPLAPDAAAEVPSPFRSPAQQQRRVLLRPTDGDWLHYSGGHLHVGVTDGYGNVLAFDRHGLRLQPAVQWPRCLVVRVKGADESAWDRALSDVRDSEWTPQSYDAGSRNCFTFVLAFLASVAGLGMQEVSREQFTRDLILPESRRAAKYLTLLRRAARRGWYRLEDEA